MKLKTRKTSSPAAYQLLHDGSLVMAEIEHNGIRIDTEKLRNTRKELAERIREKERELESDPIYVKHWRKSFGSESNLGSRPQLAHVLFKCLGFKIKSVTATNKAKADASVLMEIDLPFVKKYLEVEKLKKLDGTFLSGIEREVCDGFLHPSYNLGRAVTYRSCLAKGTLIETVRDVSRQPKGVPIEDVKVGDFVYCYGDDLKLTIKKVLWSGKTGHRKVLRIHWVARGKRGYLDLTPEHRVRLSNGDYVQARNLCVGQRTLAMGRERDRLYETGNPKHLKDHRFVYQCLVGNLSEDEVVHHKDGNHLNNNLNNLERMTKSQHAKHHAGQYLTDEARKRAVQVRRENIRLYGSTNAKGEDSHLWLHIGKFEFLRMLVRAGGKLTGVEHDFNTMKRKANLLGVNLKTVKRRFDRDGKYISIGRLKKCLLLGRTVAIHDLGVNFYKLKELIQERGIPVTRTWGNQFGSFQVHNHRITKIEKINKRVDVYDLEVEDSHNFIANEVCVHNSSSNPNFQNFPVRDALLSKIVREHFIPRKGRQLGEIDFSGIEVRIAACYHKDPTMLDYLHDPSKDMHRDSAADCYMIDPSKMTKDQIKQPRYAAKNMFVFPEFYGSYYVDCARNMWEAITKLKLVNENGESLKDHLARKGIRRLGKCNPELPPVPGTFEYHLKQVEDRLWNVRFPVYRDWKKSWYSEYLDNGGFRTLTGFWIEGHYKRNEVINFPVQGSAFHCLLWTLIRIQKWLRKNKMKTLLVGQIHDSMVFDFYPPELNTVLSKVKDVVMNDLRKAWKWIIVPMELEAEVAPVGGSWYDKKAVTI